MLGPEEKGLLCLGTHSRRHIHVELGISPTTRALVSERPQSKCYTHTPTPLPHKMNATLLGQDWG